MYEKLIQLDDFSHHSNSVKATYEVEKMTDDDDMNLYLKSHDFSSPSYEKHGLTKRSRKSRSAVESLDFDESESVMWRKHQLRRFFQDRGNWWTSQRSSTAWKWSLVILTGVLIACLGSLLQTVIELLTGVKFDIANEYLKHNKWAKGFFSFMGFCQFYAIISGLMMWWEPCAVSGGIPEIKAYLNGVDLYRFVRVKVLIAKTIGTFFSVASGLPLGKEGPMIHAGSIIGAAVSQGKTITFGFDTSWTKFQDLRNDRSKRDFVTYGAAAGVAAAFKAPIGGILFTLEEGASFWSTSLTFRAFFCAMMTMLTISLIYNGFTLGKSASVGIQFGTFETADYRTYELFMFIVLGVFGGLLGALFNKINRKVSLFRKAHYDKLWKKFAELMVITFVWSLISFVLPLCFQMCTKIPAETADFDSQEYDLLNELVQFQCDEGHYNQLASLYFTSAEVAMKQLFHFAEQGDTSYPTFGTGALILFMVPYFIAGAITSGTFCPAGLFVPTLLAGAAFGRLIGHILNSAFVNGFATSGLYALVGASAVLGGVGRMTIAGAVMIIEACGSTSYLLPCMLAFAAARYTGNAFNESIYDMQIKIKELPFLEPSLKHLGMLNQLPVSEIMSTPVVTINPIIRVSALYDLLKRTTHNGFPVTNEAGHLRGIILRKTLCTLLKLRVFSVPVTQTSGGGGGVLTGAPPSAGKDGDSLVQLAPVATLFLDTMERNYPRYPTIDEITLTASEMNAWVDVRPYMDTSAYSVHANASVQRTYKLFRTMGLRHLAVVDGDHNVTGIVTRHELHEHALEHIWHSEGDKMQKFVNLDTFDPAVVSSNASGGTNLPPPPGPIMGKYSSDPSTRDSDEFGVYEAPTPGYNPLASSGWIPSTPAGGGVPGGTASVPTTAPMSIDAPPTFPAPKQPTNKTKKLKEPKSMR
jgi:chloride channel 7